MTVYRVEIEQLDHGYEARVPAIQGFLCEGLTENETLKLLRQKLDIYLAAHAGATEHTRIRLEVFRN